MSDTKTPGQVAFESYYSDTGSPEQVTAAWHKRQHPNADWEAAAQAVLAQAVLAHAWWIPCSERLPEYDGRYAVIYTNGGRYNRIFIGDWLFGNGWSCLVEDTTVTHWMELPPIPPPPKATT